MPREEVERLVVEVSSAVRSSGFRSLLRGEDLPGSALKKRVRPISAVLEKIDAGRLLDLELSSATRQSGGARAEGPRVRDG